MHINFDLNWYVDKQRTELISAQLFQLLQAILEQGSLRAAADDCKLSYRHAWGLLQKWQQYTGHPLVNMERGKGAELTALGEKLLWEQKRILARLEPEFSNLASELTRELNALIRTETDPILQIHASHGLAVAMLREIAHEQKIPLDLKFHGSLECLKAYQSKHCDIAGFHLPEGVLGEHLLAQVLRYIHAEKDSLVYGVKRRQGIMTAPDNPHAIKTLSDLTRAPIHFINRQQNSGTRATFDLLLAMEEIDHNLIMGYDSEEFTHLAVAALVASGAADCTFGIETAARQFNLHFIPCNWENYWFVFNKDTLTHPNVSAFLELLSSAEFKQKVTALSGYDSQRSGQVIIPDTELKALLY